MAFHEVRLPARLAFGSTGGVEGWTEITTLGSGFERRLTPWAEGRRRYLIGAGLRSLDDMAALTAFFEARRGRLYGFRFRDFADFKSCAPGDAPAPADQRIATGDGAQRTFRLTKAYGDHERRIKKPVEGSVRATAENVHHAEGRADLLVSLGQLMIQAPKLKRVSLIVGWFGDDVRAGECRIRPGVENRTKTTAPLTWSVAGLDRAGAHLISEVDDGAGGMAPAYGGTPSDESVRQAIRALKDRGLEVTLYPSSSWTATAIRAGDGRCGRKAGLGGGGRGDPLFPDGAEHGFPGRPGRGRASRRGAMGRGYGWGAEATIRLI